VTLRFDSVFYRVTDLDRAVLFYRDALGLTLRSRDAVARFDVDGVLLELVPTEGPADAAAGGNARVCFEVDDLERAAAELGGRGVAVGPIRTVANGRLAEFRDPDGNELVLWQYSRR
jgi:catechol 2,3-dioxygenase-like lactoylglutathione lyase family enzyme